VLGFLATSCITESFSGNLLYLFVVLPMMLVAAPFLPIYYAVDEAAQERGGLQDACFAPGGMELVVANLTRRNMHLYAVPLDGSPARQLTDGDRFDFNPVFSPDGRYIVFSSRLGRAKRNLFKMAVDSEEITQLTQGDHEDWAPQFSPDGSFVVFMRRVKGNQPNIYIVKSDGANAAALTDGKNTYDVGPVFLPDGETILFARLEEKPKWSPKYDSSRGRRSLYTVSRTGRNLTQIANDYSIYPGAPYRTPDDTTAFTSYAGNLVVCEADTVDRLRSAGIPAIPMGRWIHELEPFESCTFSLDGKRVAYAKYEQAPGEGYRFVLRVALTVGDRTDILVTRENRISDPIFSPDGTRLAFRVKNEASKTDDLWTIRFDGTDLRRLGVGVVEEDTARTNIEREENV
jgi:Tol biopolymer transport system component